MKKITFVACALFGLMANAQIHLVEWSGLGTNPKEIMDEDEQPSAYMTGNYTGWTEILAPASTGWSSSQSIPFPFMFNGSTESSFSAHAGGLVTFSSSPAAITTGPTVLPSSVVPDKSVSIWGLSLAGANDAVVTKTFGTAPYRQQWIMWASASSATSAVSWTYWAVVLEETTNNIYIVDQRTYDANNVANVALLGGVQINSTTATSIPGVLTSLNTATGGNSDLTDNKVYAFVHASGGQPGNDVYGQNIAMSSVIGQTPATDVQADVVNFGSNSISSIEVYVQENGGTPAVQTVSGLSIASGQRATVTATGAYTPSNKGQKDIKVWFGQINGGSNDNVLNDSLYADVLVVGAVTTRFPLYESFTSSTCNPCTPGNANVEGLFANNVGQQVSLKYQMSWPGTGDPYYTLEGNDRRNYYGVSSVPNLQIDGQWGGNSSSLTQSIMDDYKAEVAFVKLDAQYSVKNQTVNVDVNIEPLLNLPAGLTLHVAIKEKLTTANVKSNGETEFHAVMKKMVPNSNGTTLGALTENVVTKQSLSYTFQGSYRLSNNAGDPINHATEHSVEEFNDLAVVVWIQDNSNKTILQAAEGTKVLGISELMTGEVAKVYPNPATDKFFIELDEPTNFSAQLTTITGQVVRGVEFTKTAKAEFNTQGLSKGVYILNITSDNGTSSQKVTIAD